MDHFVGFWVPNKNKVKNQDHDDTWVLNSWAYFLNIHIIVGTFFENNHQIGVGVVNDVPIRFWVKIVPMISLC